MNKKPKINKKNKIAKFKTDEDSLMGLTLDFEEAKESVSSAGTRVSVDGSGTKYYYDIESGAVTAKVEASSLNEQEVRVMRMYEEDIMRTKDALVAHEDVVDYMRDDDPPSGIPDKSVAKPKKAHVPISTMKALLLKHNVANRSKLMEKFKFHGRTCGTCRFWDDIGLPKDVNPLGKCTKYNNRRGKNNVCIRHEWSVVSNEKPYKQKPFKVEQVNDHFRQEWKHEYPVAEGQRVAMPGTCAICAHWEAKDPSKAGIAKCPVAEGIVGHNNSCGGFSSDYSNPVSFSDFKRRIKNSKEQAAAGCHGGMEKKVLNALKSGALQELYGAAMGKRSTSFDGLISSTMTGRSTTGATTIATSDYIDNATTEAYRNRTVPPVPPPVDVNRLRGKPSHPSPFFKDEEEGEQVYTIPEGFSRESVGGYDDAINHEDTPINPQVIGRMKRPEDDFPIDPSYEYDPTSKFKRAIRKKKKEMQAYEAEAQDYPPEPKPRPCLLANTWEGQNNGEPEPF
jgi:hypothetical protein